MHDVIWTVVVVVALVILVGSLVGFVRQGQAKHGTRAGVSQSVVRSSLALLLAAALLTLSVFAFLINDTTSRSTLIGSLTASVGATIAYYFATKSGEQVLAAATSSNPSAIVPDLTGKTLAQAAGALGVTHFKLEFDPTTQGLDTATVTKQKPLAGTNAAVNNPVVIILEQPSLNLTPVSIANDGGASADGSANAAAGPDPSGTTSEGEVEAGGAAGQPPDAPAGSQPEPEVGTEQDDQSNTSK